MVIKKGDIMPPKTRITKEMIINAGFEIVRIDGVEALNARNIASKLSCSTQPVMYCFKTMEELKNEIYNVADEYHTGYLMNIDYEKEKQMLSLGLNYIKFAIEEKNLFKFLFQSDKFSNTGFSRFLQGKELYPMLNILSVAAGITVEQGKEAFLQLFFTAHGIASLLANNSMEYDEQYCEKMLSNAFLSIVGTMKGELL